MMSREEMGTLPESTLLHTYCNNMTNDQLWMVLFLTRTTVTTTVRDDILSGPSGNDSFSSSHAYTGNDSNLYSVRLYQGGEELSKPKENCRPFLELSRIADPED